LVAAIIVPAAMFLLSAATAILFAVAFLTPIV
jgi:hypothetical protein